MIAVICLFAGRRLVLVVLSALFVIIVCNCAAAGRRWWRRRPDVPTGVVVVIQMIHQLCECLSSANRPGYFDLCGLVSLFVSVQRQEVWYLRQVCIFSFFGRD